MLYIQKVITAPHLFFQNFMSQPFVNFFLFLLKILTTTWHNDNVKKVFGRLFETLYRQVCFLSKSCLTEFWSPFKPQKHPEDGQRKQEAPAKDVNIYVHVISPLFIVNTCKNLKQKIFFHSVIMGCCECDVEGKKIWNPFQSKAVTEGLARRANCWIIFKLVSKICNLITCIVM